MQAHDIDELQQLLAAQRHTLAILLRQVALQGEAHAQPGQINGIAVARAKIARLKRALHEQGVAVADALHDQAPAPSVTSAVAAWGVSQNGDMAVSAQERRDRQQLLANVRVSWIRGVLEQSLWNKARLDLPLADRPGAVRRPYSMHERGPDGDRPLPPGTPIRRVYDDAGQSLLILGAPGAGKTTLLLELTLALLDETETALADLSGTAMPAVPVVFNLASWARGQLALEGWLARELNEQYGVSQELARRWIAEHAILPLLDGLDEVAADCRKACAEAINRFRQEQGGLLPMVVCCRERESRELPELRLQRAVVAQPLARDEIEAAIRQRGAQLAGLAEALARDPDLWALLDTPLMLSVAVLAFEGQPAPALPSGETTDVQRRALFAAYVDRMLARKPEDHDFPNAVLLARLGWLARQMRDRSQSAFQIEQLQPDWLPTRGLQRLWRCLAVLLGGLVVGLVGGLVVGLVVGLVGGLLSGLLSGLLFGLVVGLVGGLFVGLDDSAIVDRLEWSWQRALSAASLRVGLVVGLIGGLVVGLIGGLGFGLIGGLVVGLGFGLVFGLVFGLLEGLEAQTITDTERSRPNQGMHSSRRSALLGGLVSGLLIGLVVGLVSGLLIGLVVGLVSGLLSGLICGLLLGLVYGGAAVLKHYLLRMLLWRSGMLPWDITALLDAGVERVLLQRVGGRWRFVHRLLLEHLAEEDEGRR